MKARVTPGAHPVPFPTRNEASTVDSFIVGRVGQQRNGAAK